MVLKLEHELEIGNLKLKLLERRRGCGGIPKLVGLLVLALVFLLIMLCFILNEEIFFISMILLLAAKGLVLQKM
jgi:hypothetical protein